MAVKGALSFTLEVPDLEPGVKFYTDAGLEASVTGNVAHFRCEGAPRPCISLIGGKARKRLHHISLRADELNKISERVAGAGGSIMVPATGIEPNSLWVRDPHGMLIHLVDIPPLSPPEPTSPFAINAPGHLVRRGISAMKPARTYQPVKPLRLGHVLVFTPDVMRSVSFMTEALGMGLADRAQDVIAFCCGKRESDHHVVAFAKSSGVGFHHGSFEVNSPDEVGRGGRALMEKTARGEWGFGRHTIGSNFFHYIQDPWGSWFEYYSDMDYIEDYDFWQPTNYGMEDSLANWGPAVPDDFVTNYEFQQ
jgi:catechol 2,3-dioxygenase